MDTEKCATDIMNVLLCNVYVYVCMCVLTDTLAMCVCVHVCIDRLSTAIV